MLFRSPENGATNCSTSARRSTSASPSVMRLPMVFSVGVAYGFGDKDVDGQTEWLASLKIL